MTTRKTKFDENRQKRIADESDTGEDGQSNIEMPPTIEKASKRRKEIQRQGIGYSNNLQHSNF